MKKTLRLLAFVAVAILAASCSGSSSNSSRSNGSGVDSPAKYIFYFIGDGMAASQVRLAEAALTVPEFQNNYARLTGSGSVIEQLNIKDMNITGLATTNAQNRYITCSAAAATALATANKTNVGIISQDAEGNNLQTIAEKAKQKGMKVGIITSVSIDHATPACFYAHTPSRSNYADISTQLLSSGFDYFGGGSVRIDKRAAAEDTDKATAQASYVERAKEQGFTYTSTRAEFDQLKGGEDLRVIATLDMLANKQYTDDGSAMPFTIDLDSYDHDDKISLAEFTAKGIEILDNKDGFFMMVEGGKIDWACHANDAATCAYEVVAFDQAIGVALDFAAKHPDETLIVVTGDHDCGGLTIGFAGTGYESAFEILSKSNISSNQFATQAIAKIKNGASFNQLLSFACESFGFTNDVRDGSDGVITQTSELSDFEVETLRSAYRKSQSKIANNANFEQRDEYSASYGGYDPFTTTCIHILNNKSGIDFTSYSHTAVPVMVFAEGANEDLFSGYYDNTDIAKRIMEAAAL